MNERTTTKIRERAYQLFLQRTGKAGDATQDWLRAEEQIRNEGRIHLGPARIRDVRHHGKLTDPNGCDLENPT